jgi:protein involved in polysaccharide export with SLBB domain
MTAEDAKKLGPGDQIMITTSDGIGSTTAGTVLTVVGVDEDGDIVLPNNMFLSDFRRVDLYRKASVARPVPRAT